jgi:hypothetical protein
LLTRSSDLIEQQVDEVLIVKLLHSTIAVTAIGVLAALASVTTIGSEQNLQDTQMTGRCAPYPICTLIIANPEGAFIEQMLIDKAASNEQIKGKSKQS